MACIRVGQCSVECLFPGCTASMDVGVSVLEHWRSGLYNDSKAG